MSHGANFKAFHAVIPDGIYVVDDIDFLDVVDDNTIVSEITSMERFNKAKLTVHHKREDSRVQTVGTEEQYIELIQAAFRMLTVLDWKALKTKFEYSSNDWSHSPNIDIVASYYNLFVL